MTLRDGDEPPEHRCSGPTRPNPAVRVQHGRTAAVRSRRLRWPYRRFVISAGDDSPPGQPINPGSGYPHVEWRWIGWWGPDDSESRARRRKTRQHAASITVAAHRATRPRGDSR